MTGNQFCYAITVGNKTKIGLSKKPESRVRTILTQSGVRFDDATTTVIQVNDMAVCERECHRHLSDARIAGEWFSISHEDAVEAIKSFSLAGDGTGKQRRAMSLLDMEITFSNAYRPLWEKMINDAISEVVGVGCDRAIAEVVVAAAARDSSIYEMPAFLRGAGEPEVNFLSRLFTGMKSKNEELMLCDTEFRDRVALLFAHGEELSASIR